MLYEVITFEDEPSGTVFRDVLMLTLIGFVAMVIMLLPHLSAKRDENRDTQAPGNVVVEIHWPNELPVDVDRITSYNVYYTKLLRVLPQL